MAAPKGNKNAEKWNLKDSIKLFDKAIELTNKQELFYVKQGAESVKIKGYSFDFIGEIARELNTFHHIFGHLLDRFPNELEDLNNTLRNNIEQNCYYNTKKGIIREATGIVNLKSNWKWTDRLDNTSKDEKMGGSIDLSHLSTKDLMKLLKESKK